MADPVPGSPTGPAASRAPSAPAQRRGRAACRPGRGPRPAASRMAAPDLSRPRRVHIVGIGGAGMSAIATVLLGHGPPGERQRRRRLGPVAAAGRGGRRGARGPRPALARGRGRGRRLHGHPADQRRGGRGRSPGPAGMAAGRECWPPSAAERRTVAVAGTHGKTTHLGHAGGDPAPGRACTRSYIVGGDMIGLGSGRGVGTGWRVAGRRSGRERRHLPRAGRGSGRGHQRRARPSGLLRRRRRPARRRSCVSWRPRRGPRVVCADEPGAMALAAGAGRGREPPDRRPPGPAPRHDLRHRSDAVDPHRGRRARADRRGVLGPAGRPAATIGLARCPGSTTSATPRPP